MPIQFKKYNRLIFLPVLVVFTGIFIYLSVTAHHVQDDAFIGFRYLENFINGNGLVFNPGEHVEGFTSFLWLMFLIPFKFFGADLPLAAQLSGLLMGIGTIWISYFITDAILSASGEKESERKDQKISNQILSFSPGLFLVFNGAFRYWTASGMETSMFTFLLMCSVLSYLYLPAGKILDSRTSIFISLLLLTRPEGFLVFISILIFNISRNKYFNESKVSFIRLFFNELRNPSILIIIIPAAAYFIFRMLYYGYPLPNTFYAKSSLSIEYIKNGLDYFFNFSNTYLLSGFIIILPLFLFTHKKYKMFASLLYLIIVIFSVYTILIGGDSLPLFRFLIPVVPLIYIIFVLFLELVLKSLSISSQVKKPKYLQLIVVMIVVIITFDSYNSPKSYIQGIEQNENYLVRKMKATAIWLSEKNEKQGGNITVAATTIGALSYYSNVKIIDMLGLTDNHIAHNPKPDNSISRMRTNWKEKNYDADYILSRKPDYIYFSTGIKPSAFAERALFTKQDFFINYFPYYFIQPGIKLSEYIYKRKSDKERELMSAFKADTTQYGTEFIDLYNKVLNLVAHSPKLGTLLKMTKKLVKISPPYFSDAYRLYGTVLLKLSMVEEGINNLYKAISIDPMNTEAHYNLMLYHNFVNDFTNSEIQRTFLMKHNPEFLDLLKESVIN